MLTGTLLCATLGGCVVRAAQPLPPAADARATTVYLISEEGHTGVLLPDGGRWVEWAFGDYAWYANGRGDFGWGLYTAMRATAGGLGRRVIDGDPLADPWSRARGTILFPYRVEPQRVAALSARLEEEFGAGGQPTFNPLFGFWVVPASAPYSMWFNCTDATADWLEALGVEAWTTGICSRILGDPGTELSAPPPEDGILVRDRIRAFTDGPGTGTGR